MGKLSFSERSNSAYERFFTRFFISLFVVLIAFAVNLPVQAQKVVSETDVPEGAKTALKQNFSDAQNVVWLRPQKEKGYLATMVSGGKLVRAFFSEKGELFRKVTPVLPDELPSNIQLTVKGQYSDYKIRRSVKIEKLKKKKTIYRLRLTKQKESKLIFFDENGKLLDEKDKSIDPQDKEKNEDGEDK